MTSAVCSHGWREVPNMWQAHWRLRAALPLSSFSSRHASLCRNQVLLWCQNHCPYESRRGKNRGRKADGGGWGQEMQSRVLQIWRLVCFPGTSSGEMVSSGETISERLSSCFQKCSSTNFLMSCGYLLLQLDTRGFQSCAASCHLGCPCWYFFIISDSLLSHFWFTARGRSLSSTPAWPLCLAPSLRAICLLDSPHYAATPAFSPFHQHFHECQPHTLPFCKTRTSASKPVLIPSFPPVQAHSFSEVQPCSAGGGQFKRDPLGSSKNVSGPGQNNKWGNLHRFPHCSAVYCGSWSAFLRCPGFPGLVASPPVCRACLTLADVLLFFFHTDQWGTVISYLLYHVSPLSSLAISAIMQSQPSTRQSVPTSSKSALEKWFSWMVNISFSPQ